MEQFKLEDLFDLQMGKTPSRNESCYWNTTDYKWISIGDLTKCGKYITDTKEYISECAVKKTGISLIPANTVVMSFKLSIGKTAITGEPMYSNEAIMSFRDKHVVDLLPDYIYYLLSGRDWDDGTNKAVMGKTLNKATLSKIRVNIHSIEQQRTIVTVLDTISAIIEARRKELSALDDLIKARFVEMFGDMLFNTKGLPEYHLDMVADIVSGITKGRKVKSNELYDVPYMAVSNVKDGYIDWTTVKTILATEMEINQYRLLAGDVLMTEGGDPDKLGRGAIIHEPPADCIHQNHIFRVRLNQDYILPVFMTQYLQQQKAKRYFLGCAKQTTGIASINMKQLKALPVLIPPIEAQNAYAAFVAEVDKSKYAFNTPYEIYQSLSLYLTQGLIP